MGPRVFLWVIVSVAVLAGGLVIVAAGSNGEDSSDRQGHCLEQQHADSCPRAAARRCRCDRARAATLEDIFGDTGSSFQGSIGIVNFESDWENESKANYGVGVDDLVVTWREFALTDDQTDCNVDLEPGDPGGSCATVDFDSSLVFESRSRLTITVTESSPSGNDCDGNGTPDFPVNFDCNDNGVPDLYALATSTVEPSGERVLCEELSPDVYIGSLPVSSSYDVPGTLFVQSLGTTNPSVNVRYDDLDDGTGQICKNDLNPEGQGKVGATLFLPTVEANLQLDSVVLDDIEGDGDRVADDNETVEMFVSLSNKGLVALTDIELRLQTNDPKVDCIQNPAARLGDLNAGETKQAQTPFRFRVGHVGRTSVDQLLGLEFRLLASGTGFDSVLAPQELFLLADLDFVGGSGPGTFIEGFEGGFGQFTTMHIDESLNPPPGDLGNDAAGVINADDHRCQYSDPDWENAISFGTDEALNCYPNADGQPDTYYWQTTVNRSFLGNGSLYWGIELEPALGQTHPAAQLEAIRTIDPINFGWADVCSITRTMNCDTDADCAPPACPACLPDEDCVPARNQLSFKHQISLVDHRTVSAGTGRGAERGAVHMQLADANGTPTSEWIKLVPFQNVYDSQGNENYFNCTFDPADDGNTEDDFFDPADPDRSMGPSSTCFPEFSFMHQGDSFDFGTGNLGDASDGPGLPGGPADGGAGSGVGTWIQPKFDMQTFRGQRGYLRFLVAGLKLAGLIQYEDAFAHNPDPGDDGWWIDDVRVTDTLTTPATISVDNKDNSGLPVCGPVCTGVLAALSAEPTSLAVPGGVVRLDASASEAPQCSNGVLQYQFLKNGALLRDWTDNPKIVDAPNFDTAYGVNVRCATDVGCSDSEISQVDVTCPSSGPADLIVLAKAGGAEFDVIGQFSDLAVGEILDLRSVGYVANVQPAAQVDDPNVPADHPLLSTPSAGDGKWVLVKGGCQATFWGADCSATGAGSCTLESGRNVALP